MLEKSELDALIIGTPMHLHVLQTIAALMMITDRMPVKVNGLSIACRAVDEETVEQELYTHEQQTVFGFKPCARYRLPAGTDGG
jgi:hypothetical protein